MTIDRKSGGGGRRGIDNTLIEQIVTPGVDDGRRASTRFLQHVEGAVGGDDMEHGFHAVLDHSFFKGCNGGDNGVGIRFVGHAKEKGRRVTEAEMTLVFNGCHGRETFDDVGVEFTHAMSALGIFSLSVGTIASPDSSW